MDESKVTKDFTLEIATAHSRLSKKWKNKKVKWSELVQKCASTYRTDETLAEYSRMGKDEQSRIKDVGGFVGGYIANGERKTQNVLFRSCATLDLDFATDDTWDLVSLNIPYAAVLYSTHKHTKENPRYRLILPFNRQVRPDEYEPLCRKIASYIDIEQFDTTTYQTARLFYWPSTSKDGEFVFHLQDGDPLDVDKELGGYVDFHDVSSWPLSSKEGEIIKREMKKAGDPLEKGGLIGAFCRAYTIEDVIDKFLQDEYEPTAIQGRYTYKRGTAAAGLVCYEGKFAYANNDTDPSSRQLCNAFDLVRIHKFGVQDEGSRVTDSTRLPSYLAMQDFVAKDSHVRQLLTIERRKQAADDFSDIEEVDEKDVTEVEDMAWTEMLEYDSKGTIKSTSMNAVTILEKDANFKGKMWHNDFSGFDYIDGGLPWNKKARVWSNEDEANLRVYMESNYGLSCKDKIKDARVAVVTKNKRHPIKEYLKGLVWDGAPRLDRLIIDYIGAEDCALTRAMTRKHFVAAVARVMQPGIKYDYCLILTGAEGVGKSTLFSIMGGEWFSDSLTTMEGKDGMEQLRGGWIFELSELSSIKRSEVEQVKAFISKQTDTYRPAYGVVREMFPRQCVFCGTTNETYFLKGDTGNRRFWVIEVDESLKRVKDTREALIKDRDQLWAEAVHYYNEGEQLFLSKVNEDAARKRQQDFNDNSDDPWVGMIQNFLDTKLPPDWAMWDLQRRREFYRGEADSLSAVATMPREKVYALEFLTEVLRRDIGGKELKYEVRKFNRIVKDLEWGEYKVMKINQYGLVKGFLKKLQNETDNDDEEDL